MIIFKFLKELFKNSCVIIQTFFKIKKLKKLIAVFFYKAKYHSKFI